MHIENLDNTGSIHSITITFNYNEVRDIANGLYLLVNLEGAPYNPNLYLEVAAKAAFMFDMIKHGMIQPDTVSELSKTALNKDEFEILNNSLTYNSLKVALENPDFVKVYNKISNGLPIPKELKDIITEKSEEKKEGE